LRIQLPARAWQLRKTKLEIVAEVDRLLEQCTDSEIAAKLNSKGWRSSGNQSFDARMIRSFSTSHKLPFSTALTRISSGIHALERFPLTPEEFFSNDQAHK
jgi:hypothetical protein